MFCQSKNICDFLIVALHEDPSIERPSKMKPILSSAERKKILNSIKYIDLVIPYSYEKDLYDLLLTTDLFISLSGNGPILLCVILLAFNLPKYLA